MGIALIFPPKGRVGERPQLDDFHPAGQGVRESPQRQDPRGAGEEEPPGPLR